MCQASVGEKPKAKLFFLYRHLKASVLIYLSQQGQAQAVSSGGSRKRAGALWFPTAGAGALPLAVLSRTEKVVS